MIPEQKQLLENWKENFWCARCIKLPYKVELCLDCKQSIRIIKKLLEAVRQDQKEKDVQIVRNHQYGHDSTGFETVRFELQQKILNQNL